MSEAAVSVLVCRCGTPMSGPPQNGRTWTCAKNHQFRVTAAGATVTAVALRGDRGAGVDMKRNYIWRPVAGVLETRPSPS